MKTLLSFTLITLISNNLLAQVSSEPLRLNKNILVHSAGLPEEFLLFVPDSATQILFNPARANNFSSSFIYLNYLSDYQSPAVLRFLKIQPYQIIVEPQILGKGNIYSFPSVYEETYSSSKNPSFSIASLIKDGDAGWLLSLTNGINNQESRYYSLAERNRNDITSAGNFNDYNYTQNRSNSELEVFVTTLKASGIWGKGTNFSLGVFGILYNNDSNNESNSDNLRYTVSSSTLTDSSRQISLNKYLTNEYKDSEDSKFAVGIEFSATQSNWDYIGSFSYQKNNNSINSSRKSYNNEYDSSWYTGSTQWQVSSSNRTIERIGGVESNPYILNINNYFQHSVNWITDNDNIFVTLDGFYSPGEKVYEGMFQNLYYNYNNGILSFADTSFEKFSGVLEGKNWGINISAGYALKESLSDINFLTGFRLTGSRNYFDDVLTSVSSQVAFIELVNKISSASIVLPIYLNYTPAGWFSVYGGFNYTYMYTFYKFEYNYFTEAPSLDEVTNYYSGKNTDWQSKKSIYLGCELRHHSGLKIQFFFDDNFTSIRNWNVSIGYHF